MVDAVYPLFPTEGMAWYIPTIDSFPPREMFESCRLHQIEPKPRKPVSCVDGFHPFVFHSCINDDKYTCPRCYTNGKQPLATTHETKNNKNNSMLCQSLISFLAYAGLWPSVLNRMHLSRSTSGRLLLKGRKNIKPSFSITLGFYCFSFVQVVPWKGDDVAGCFCR